MTTAIPSPEDVARNPVLFAQRLLKVMDKRDRVIPLRYNAMQREYLSNRTGRDLILKARQIGFSTAIQAELFRYATTRAARTLTLANDFENTQKLRRMVDCFYDHLPEGFQPERGTDNATLTTYPGYGSEATIATAGNRNSGRAGSYRFIHCSEVAFYPDAERLVASALQAGEPRWVVMESTPNGAQGWFYDACVNAMRGKGVWKLHFFPWFRDASYRVPLRPDEVLEYDDDELALIEQYRLTPEQLKWRRVKKDEVGFLFDQEYPTDPTTCFLTSGSTTFTGYTLYTPPEQAALDDHLYVLGVDWSGGGQGDADSHAVSIADATDYREVFTWTTRQRDDDAVLDDIVELVKRWRVIAVVPELNSMGTTLSARLHKFLHERGHNWGRNSRGESLAPVVSGIFMTNPVKDNLVKSFRAAFKAGYKLVDDPTGNDELLSFVSRQLPSGLWTYGAKSGKHDDLTIARLLAHSACYAHKGY